MPTDWPKAAAFFRPTILLALALMAVILMMVLPVPAWVLDIGLALSFALAILMLTVTLFIERPLDFSAFPTILLASLMLRLSLNVSSTKLIIGQGHTGTGAAGHVIEGFAEFIMGGNLLLGLVIFCVLLIVNFVVITKGAGRMAEVGARFALDGMPGKQLAIDADMAAGAIDPCRGQGAARAGTGRDELLRLARWRLEIRQGRCGGRAADHGAEHRHGPDHGHRSSMACRLGAGV